MSPIEMRPATPKEISKLRSLNRSASSPRTKLNFSEEQLELIQQVVQRFQANPEEKLKITATTIEEEFEIRDRFRERLIRYLEVNNITLANPIGSEWNYDDSSVYFFLRRPKK